MTQSTSQLLLSTRDLELFHSFRIPDELLLRYGVQRVSDEEARLDFGLRGSHTQDFSGIAFPYYDPKTGYRTTVRVRRDHFEIKDGKPEGKYRCAWGDRKHLFFPPDAAQRLEDPEVSVILVEAEKSVLALDAWADRMKQKICPIGLGGCWGFLGRIGKRTTPNGDRVDETGPLDDLHYCDGRRVYVMLDSNAETNRAVKAAQRKLVRELKRRGCEVLICHLPQVDGVNGGDDYIAGRGDEAMEQVFAAATAGRLTHDYGGGRFELSEERGVEYVPPPDKDGLSKPLWICAPLYVTAKTRDSQSKEWGRLLEWQDADGSSHQWAMPVDLLQRDGGVEARCELARQGLTLSPGKAPRELLTIYLQVWPTDVRARCVNRLGWFNTTSGMLYVLPTLALSNAGERVVFQNVHALEPAFAVSGSTAEWREQIASLAQGNTRLVFSISVAFAGPLLELANDTSGGFHVRGPSSTGKTTVLELSASVWGHPAKYCRRWRATVNGLEGLAALHNDGLLILDELSQVDPREAGEAGYLLANEQGKTRASRLGTARPAASWRLLFLSAGEESLASLMTRIGRKPTVGQEVRLAEINSDAGSGMGVLEQLHTHEKPEALIQTLREQVKRYHGAVGAEYLRVLVRDRTEIVTSVRDDIRDFIANCVPPASAGGQVERVARRFALVGVAGELATKYGLTGWPKGEAMKAAGVCFVSWLNLFGGRGNREERQLLEQVRAFLEANGSSRFENADADDKQRIINRCGFYRVVETETIDGYEVSKKGGQREYLVLPQAFRNELCAGFDLKFAVHVLKEHQWLIPGKDKTAQSITLPGMGKTRVYVIGARLWEDGQ